MPQGTIAAFFIKVAAVLFVLIFVGVVVGGMLYGPQLRKAWTEATKQKTEAVVAGAETDLAQANSDAQSGTQRAEIAVSVQLQEQSREILSSPGADTLVDPDLYDRVADGLRSNQFVRVGPTADSSGPAGSVPDTGTPADRP